MGNEYDLTNFFLEKYGYSTWFEDEELDDTISRKKTAKESDMPPIEGDEEVKLQPEETIAEKVKLIPQKRKKNKNRIKSFNSTQTIN